MKTKHFWVRLFLLAGAACLLFVFSVGTGSVSIAPGDVLAILKSALPGMTLRADISALTASILLDIRLPRVVLAFLCGAALSVSGVVMQSVLRNPLASSYTLGVSSGASLGAALVLLTGLTLPAFAGLTLPLSGFLFALGTVFLALGMSAHFDAGLRSETVVLTGMVLSLFISAVITLLSALNRDFLNQLIFWQMGSFSGANGMQNTVLAGVLVLCLPLLLCSAQELDLLTFGDELAATSGLSPRRARTALVTLATLLTGTAVSFCGTIGFVDLIVPHLARRLFGVRHHALIVSSALLGGCLMMLSDLAARTVLSPRELPVGAVTALVGAPFFAYLYFSKKGGGKYRG